jgi:hypothetical protein
VKRSKRSPWKRISKRDRTKPIASVTLRDLVDLAVAAGLGFVSSGDDGSRATASAPERTETAYGQQQPVGGPCCSP